MTADRYRHSGRFDTVIGFILDFDGKGPFHLKKGLFWPPYYLEEDIQGGHLKIEGAFGPMAPTFIITAVN